MKFCLTRAIELLVILIKADLKILNLRAHYFNELYNPPHGKCKEGQGTLDRIEIENKFEGDKILFLLIKVIRKTIKNSNYSRLITSNSDTTIFTFIEDGELIELKA